MHVRQQLGHFFPAFDLRGFEAGVSLPLHDLISGLDGGVGRRFGDMAFLGSRRADQESGIAFGCRNFHSFRLRAFAGLHVFLGNSRTPAFH